MFTPATTKHIRPCKIPFPKNDSSLKEGETIVCIFHWSNAAGCYGAGAADEGGYLRLSDHQGHPGTLCRIRIHLVSRAAAAAKNGSLTTYDRPYQGRNRRYYRITVSGRALLDQYRKDWLTYKQQVDFFLDEK